MKALELITHAMSVDKLVPTFQQAVTISGWYQTLFSVSASATGPVPCSLLLSPRAVLAVALAPCRASTSSGLF
jgi:hypothetical protein